MHPKAQRDAQHAVDRTQSANTFEAIAKEWMERCRTGVGRKRSWTPKYATQVERALVKYVFPKFGALPIRMVGASHTRQVIDAMAVQGIAVTAINVRQWCGAIFAYAVRTERADTDPTFALRRHIERPDVTHKTPLTKDGVKDLREKIKASDAFRETQIALELLLLLFVRPGELRQSEWVEFDTERAVWTIPAEKMKKREKHLVPLSTQAIALLQELHRITGHQRWLFPNSRKPNACMSDTTLNAALRRLGYGGQFSAHGFRATASTELHELGYRSNIIEFQLAHAERDETKASYNQAQFWKERQQLMQNWSDLVDAWGKGGNVVSIGRAA